jgi:hypothetical protein
MDIALESYAICEGFERWLAVDDLGGVWVKVEMYVEWGTLHPSLAPVTLQSVQFGLLQNISIYWSLYELDMVQNILVFRLPIGLVALSA